MLSVFQNVIDSLTIGSKISPLIPQSAVDFYRPVFQNLPLAEQRLRILQLWTSIELSSISYEDSFLEHLSALAKRSYFPNPIVVQESVSDWQQNMNVGTKTWRGYGGVHEGCSDNVEITPIELIEKLVRERNKQLLVTGHSKGGAGAYLFASAVGSDCDLLHDLRATTHI
ncbi:hypothetical protein HK098_008157 [Nowakowskiella sp. JEL0407]|nr:hypothetical protein HK098_008157 [Nowakowskiella sp. JEL0407]